MSNLISREALKKEVALMFGDKTHITESVCELIDNAPTVDIKDQIAGAYNEGYMCGNKEAEKERPQGEWITIDAFVVKCSVCGVESFATPFCPRCGADMRKGGAEC